MTPPNGSGGDGSGNGSRVRQAQIIDFPTSQNGSEGSRPAASEPPPSQPPASTSAPPYSRDSFLAFSDFSVLGSLKPQVTLAEAHPTYSRVQLSLSHLANPLANGGYDATFSQNGTQYHVVQTGPGEPIEITHSVTISAKKSGNLQRRSVHFISYHLDGKVSHTSEFDSHGKPINQVTLNVDQLRRARFSDHSLTLSFLESRLRDLNLSLGTFKSLEAHLQHLRGRPDIGKRAVWYDNYVVLNEKIYTLRTQNLGFPGFENSPSQNQIAIFEQQGNKQVEVFRISETGEIDYDPEIRGRQLPSRSQSDLLRAILRQVAKAHQHPLIYQEEIKTQLEALRTQYAGELTVPEIKVRNSLPVRTSTRGTMGEPILTITRGRDLWKLARPYWLKAPTHTWQNPENPTEMRYLRPEGSIRRAMTWELLRWMGQAVWHGGVDDHRNVKGESGHLKLHLLPDGSADLEIFRNYERPLSDGRRIQERGIYNIIRRMSDGTTFNLDQVIASMGKTDPNFRDLPRQEQVRLAAQSISSDSKVPTNLELQVLPPLSFDNLNISSEQFSEILSQTRRDNPGVAENSLARGPRTAAQAYEAIQRLPELAGLRARVSTTRPESLGLREAVAITPEGYYHLDFPGGYPRTSVEIHEENLNAGKRVIVHLTQGDNRSTSVFDDGHLNGFESRRLNTLTVERARMGSASRNWGSIFGRGLARSAVYVNINGRAYSVGYGLSLPMILGFERLYFNDRERELLGFHLPSYQGDSWKFIKDTWQFIKHESFTAGSMYLGAGIGSLGVDGLFNYGNGMLNVLRDWRGTEATFRQAYRHHIPRIFNPPPILARPIPPQAWYLRNFLQRGIPLITGLIGMDMYRRGSWIPRVDAQVLRSAVPIGALSFTTSSLWALAQHSLNRQYTRYGSEQAFHGIAGALYRAKFLRTLPTPIGGARFAMTARATFLTVALEMAALQIWHSYDRKQQFLAQEGNFRDDLSSAIDRRNRIMSRLENGEEIPPFQIQAAAEEVHGAYLRYRRFLEIIDPRESEETRPSISLQNDYGEAYESYRQTAGSLSLIQDPSSSNLLAGAQYTRDHRLAELHDQENQLRQRLNNLYERHGIPAPTESTGQESLREFIARITQRISENPEILQEALGSGRPSEGSPAAAEPPVTLNSSDGRAIIEHLQWKIAEDPGFRQWDMQRQARYILREFSGYRVSQGDGTTRPWNEPEAIAFLAAVESENQRRVNNLEEPLIGGSSREAPNPELQTVAREEERITQEIMGTNVFQAGIRHQLANNPSDLDRQMEDYEGRITRRTDQALLRMFPQEFLARVSLAEQETRSAAN